jgi:putative endonuclease
MDYFVYILSCADGTLYTGITNDVENRIAAHNDGKASKYTRCRRPVALAFKEACGDRSAALRRELELKKLTREAKLRLIAGYSGPL